MKASEEKQPLQYVEATVHGITVQIPVNPTLGVYAVSNSTKEWKPIIPAWATLLQAREGKPSPKQLKAARLGILKDRYSELRRQAGCRIKTYKGPVVCTPAQSAGTYSIDSNGCIVLNEAQMAERWVDTDGDRGYLIIDGDRALFIKFPMHLKPLLLVHEEPSDEQWTDIPQIPEAVKANPGKEEFQQKHKTAPVGLITNFFDFLELSAASREPSYEKALEHVLSLHNRAPMIENPMAVSRHSGTKANELPTSTLMPSFKTGWRSAKSLDARYHTAIAFMPSDEVVEGMRSLRGIQFGTKKINQNRFDLGDYPKLGKGKGIVARLRKIGVLSVTERPHQDPDMPPVIVLSLNVKTKKGWRKCSLVDCKRGQSKHLTSPLTYSYVVPPFIDFSGSSNEVTPRHPLQVLEEYLSQFDCQTSQGLWPVSYTQFKQWPVRISMIENSIREFVSRYGYVSNDEAISKGEPNTTRRNAFLTMKFQVASSVVTVRYSSNSPEAMWYQARQVQKFFEDRAVDFSPFGGDKQSSETFRRYCVCPKGQLTPSWSSPWADPSRISHIKSQVAPALVLNTVQYDENGDIRRDLQGKPIVSKVLSSVFVFGGSEHGELKEQLFASPSGVEKQRIDSVLIRSFSNVPKEGAIQVVYPTLTGDTRMGWVQPQAESCIYAGKMITTYGTKNQIKVLDHQMVTVDGKQIDFAVPYFDWLKKGALPAMLKELDWEVTEMIIGGKTVKGILIHNLQFLRSTNPGENKKPTKSTQTFTGLESHMVQQAIWDHGFPEPDHETNLERAEALRKLYQDLSSLFKSYLTEDDHETYL